MRLGDAHGDYTDEPLEDVVLGDRIIARLEHTGRLCLLIEHLDDGPVESRDVGSTLGSRDDVDEGAHIGVVSRGPAQRDVDAELALDLLRRQVPLVIEDRHRLVEVSCAMESNHPGDRFAPHGLDEFSDAALVLERLR